MSKMMKRMIALLAALLMIIANVAALAEEAPATEVPATEVPATETSATEAPATEAPATEVPATETPATEAPATEAPATETPAPEETPAIIIEPTTTPDATAPAIDLSQLEIRIRTNAQEVALGDQITLRAELTGFDGLNYSLQWQIDDGNGWKDIKGESGDHYTFVLSEDNMNADWRVQVIVHP